MPAWLLFLFWTFAGFIGLELVSYVLHRWLFHGVLWPMHRTHHVSRHAWWEWNDLFSVGFAGVAIALLWIGKDAPLESVGFPIGLGLTIYGFIYFLVHDLYTHRRFWPFRSQHPLMRLLQRAHLKHHQSVETGQRPFGLFLVAYRDYPTPRHRRRPRA